MLSLRRRRACVRPGLVRRIVLVAFLAVCGIPVQGQDTGPWRGRQCAVALTYDDALRIDLDTVVPLLDSLGFRGTFYVPGSFPGFTSRLSDWNAIAKEGHELGNHTLFHPCDGSVAGRDWVLPEYNLKAYSVRRMIDEVKAANTLLEAVDGKVRRTLAYPCGDTKARDSSYVEAIRPLCVAARGVVGRMETLDHVDLYDIGAYMINGETGDQLIHLVKEGIRQHALVVFLFHGVGGGHSINVSAAAHRELLRFLKDHEREIWVAPLIDIADYVAQHREAPKQ